MSSRRPSGRPSKTSGDQLPQSPVRHTGWLRAGLAFGAVVGTLLILEIGVRIYYAVADVPTMVTFGSSSEDWKARWIERHRDQGVDIYYGFDRYDPLLGWRIRPNLRQYKIEGLPPVTTNAQGWRALHDYSPTRRPGVTRIVALGDSFTFGEQEDDENVWPSQLERQLDATEVLNLGVHGYGTDQQLRLLEIDGLSYHPDVVVLGFFVEDILRNGLAFRDYAKPMFVLRNGALVLTNSPVPAPEKILADASGARPWSYLADFVRTRLGGLGGARLDDIVDERDLFSLTRAILQRMAGDTSRAGAKLLVVVIPSTRAMPRVEASVMDWASTDGYAAIDVGPALEAAQKTYGRPVFQNFYHSTFGDFVMATAVRDALVGRGWVSAPSAATKAATARRLEQLTGR